MPGRRTNIVAFVLTTALVFGITSAQAAGNIVLNPGFETTGGGCGSLPCNWTADQGAAPIVRDTSNPHSGAASLALVSDNSGGSFTQAISDCFALSASTTYNEALWYRTTASSASVSSVNILLRVWDGPNCTGNLSNANAPFTNLVRTGAWTELTAQITPGFGIVSGAFMPRFDCPSACAAGVQVNYDDVVVQTDPLAVTVASFSAQSRSRGVLLQWRTGTEADLLGFKVYRSRGHSWQNLTRSLIGAKDSVSGAAYRFLDRTAKRGGAYSYRIKAVNRDGTASWFGPVRVT
jgi:hypothetical protein